MNVLFVGNSHTFTHDVPSMINQLFVENNLDWSYKEMTVSGETLLFHSKRKELLEEISKGNYDIIVLQERASNFNQSLFNDGFKALYDYIIKNCDSQILMYMIWSNESRPEVQRVINESYVDASKKDRVFLAPVGVAWDIIRHNHKDIVLYSDGNHATLIGAYLAATMIFYSLIGRKKMLDNLSLSRLVKRLNLNMDKVYLIHEIICKVVNTDFNDLDKLLSC